MLLRGRLRDTGSWRSPDAKRRRDFPGFRHLQEVLEVAIFGKDIGERLFHHIICGCGNESGVLIDQERSRVSEPYGCADLADLGNFEQWHWSLLRVLNQAIFLRAIMRCAVAAISLARALQSAAGNSKRRRTSSMV